MPASSSKYSSEIQPDPSLRLAVSVAGAALAVAGVAVLATMPVPFWPRALAVLGWTGYSLFLMLALSERYRRVRSYRFHADATVDVRLDDGSVIVAGLAPGSVLLRRVAWIRLVIPGRPAWSELVAGDARQSQQWRRFQVICRHLGPC